jgi:hypothetical protein
MEARGSEPSPSLLLHVLLVITRPDHAAEKEKIHNAITHVRLGETSRYARKKKRKKKEKLVTF